MNILLKDIAGRRDRYRYGKGMEKGAEQKGYEVVKNLLSADKFSIAEIANFANVSEAFVKKVKSGNKN